MEVELISIEHIDGRPLKRPRCEHSTEQGGKKDIHSNSVAPEESTLRVSPTYKVGEGQGTAQRDQGLTYSLVTGESSEYLYFELMARSEVRNLPELLYTGIKNSNQWNEEDRSGTLFTTAVQMAVPLKPTDMLLVVKMGYRYGWEMFTKFGFGGLTRV